MPPHDDMPDMAPTPSERLFEALHRASRFCLHGHHHHHHHGKHGPIHPGQNRILALLAERGELGQRELLDIAGIRSASLSELVAKLERAGFVQRRRHDADRRSVILSLTGEGQDYIRRVRAVHAEHAAAVFSVLSEAEQRRLTGLLERLLTSWRDRRDAPPEHARHGRHGRRQRRGERP